MPTEKEQRIQLLRQRQAELTKQSRVQQLQQRQAELTGVATTAGIPIPGQGQQFEQAPQTIARQVGRLQSRLSEAIGLGGDPIFRGGEIGEFAKQKGGELATGVKEEGVPFIGETVGEFAGSKFGPKGRAIGAGLGRGAGVAFRQIGQQIVDSPNAPQSSKDAAAELLKEMAIASGTEIVSDKVLNASRRLATTLGFKSTAVKPLPDFDDVARLAKKAGIDLTPAQRTASRAVDTFEEIAENAFFGRGRLRDVKQIAQPAGIRRATDTFLDSVLPQAQRVGRDELGNILSDTITEKNTAFRKAGAAIYRRVDKLHKAASVDLSSLKAFATAEKKRRLKEGGVSQPIDTVIEDLLSRPDVTDFATAHRIRSGFLEVARNAPSKKDRVVGVTKQASKLVDRQMEKASLQLSPDAAKVWRAANGFWKNGKEVFNSKVIRRVTRSVLDETPDKVFDVIFQAKSPKQIKTVMDLVDPLTKKRLQFAFLDGMLGKSTKQIPGDISDLRTLLGKSFLERFDSFGDEALDAVLTKDQKENVRTLARLAKTTQGRTGGAGGFLIQLIQAAPLGATGTGIVAGQPELVKKGLVTGIPVAAFTDNLSRLIVSPRGSKILTDMINVPKGGKEAVALGARLSREIGRIQVDRKREELQSTKTTEAEAARARTEERRIQQQRGIGRF